MVKIKKMNNLVVYALENFYGIQEIPGINHNPLILKIFKAIGHGWVKDDETAWCAAIHSYIHMKCGYKYTGKLNALSWKGFGKKLDKPVLGCTAVYWRISPTSGYGHVAFFIREDGNYDWVLGGNQNNSYNIAQHSKEKLIGYFKIEKDENILIEILGIPEREKKEYRDRDLAFRHGTGGVLSKSDTGEPGGVDSDNRRIGRGSGNGRRIGENKNSPQVVPLLNKTEKEIGVKNWFNLEIPLSFIHNLFTKGGNKHGKIRN